MLNRKILKFGIFCLLTICLFALAVSAQDNQPEKVKAVKTVTGKFVRFEVGDYVHATIRKSDGKLKSFWIGKYGVDYFIVANRTKTMIFTYEVVDAYIHENGGRMTIERLKSAKIGRLTSEKWLKNLEKRYSYKQIEKRYEPLVNKFTKNY